MSIEERMQATQPVIKFPGGKRQLLPELSAKYPEKITRYAEPFVGGAAVYFDVYNKHPELEKALLIDINRELINLYSVIKSDIDGLLEELSLLNAEYYNSENKSAVFYAIRAKFNLAKDQSLSENSKAVGRAAQVIFLNKTCFNGLFRFNSKNEFNSPFGKYQAPTILNEELLRSANQALQKADILLGDFSYAKGFVDSSTFVYYDPPYKPISKTANFRSYSSNNFNDSEQIRLCRFFREMDEQGAKQMLSNSDVLNLSNDRFFEELYAGFSIERVKARRSIASSSDGRNDITEIVVRNF